MSLLKNKPIESDQETVDVSQNEDPNLAAIRYYHSTFKNFFDYWKGRGVEADPYKGVELTHPVKRIQDKSTLPYQDFGTYEKSKKNKLTESFENFITD